MVNRVSPLPTTSAPAASAPSEGFSGLGPPQDLRGDELHGGHECGHLGKNDVVLPGTDGWDMEKWIEKNTKSQWFCKPLATKEYNIIQLDYIIIFEEVEEAPTKKQKKGFARLRSWF